MILQRRHAVAYLDADILHRVRTRANSRQVVPQRGSDQLRDALPGGSGSLLGVVPDWYVLGSDIERLIRRHLGPPPPRIHGIYVVLRPVQAGPVVNFRPDEYVVLPIREPGACGECWRMFGHVGRLSLRS